MGKRSRRLKREAARATLATDIPDIPGGVIGAMHRNRNGQATKADVDFLLRMSLEARGRDGYTGESKPSNSGYTFHTSHAPSHPMGFHTSNTHPTSSNNNSYNRSGDDHVFHCAEASEITSKCPLNPPIPSILIPITMWECFLACCKEYDTEWIALLMGKEGKDHKGEPAYIIDKFYFPPQTASGAHVDVPTGVKPKPGTIGAIHSHVDMGVFWSHTDTSHSNWPVEIVINRKEQYEALSRYKLKCGEWAKGKSEVRLTGSYVSLAVQRQVDASFAAGDMLAKKATAARIATSSPSIASIVPAGVHPDDRDDVKEAIVKANPSVPAPMTGWGMVPCRACNHYSHTSGFKCGAPDCKCEAFIGDGSVEEICSTVLCVRPNKHAGYHRTMQGDYFQYKADVKDEPQTELDFHSTTTITDILVPAKDDPTISGELPPEEYCTVCEGYGLVEEGVGTAVPCKDCKGTGLSALGRVRAAESMLN